mmetsp:Transcript_4858/g.11247  ORF Transcript_4858/g.11247 Transcript_4858/m.11247 type:complete len:177 (-) Transcript_4858:97-627(-)
MSARERSRSPAGCESSSRASTCEARGVVLDFDVQRHIQLRRSRQPVFGLPLGTLPSNPQQNSQLGAPFAYVPEQLQPSEAARSAQSVVCDDLRARGYFVVSAVRHGFDFVVYEGDPARHHGSYFVVVVDSTENLPPRQLVLWHRLAASAHKALLLALPSPNKAEAPRYWVLSGDER